MANRYQFPDGTVEFTSPSGRSYVIEPGGGQRPGRGVMMPRRMRTRAEELQDRISAERRINEVRIVEERRQYEAWLAATYEPPPF